MSPVYFCHHISGNIRMGSYLAVSSDLENWGAFGYRSGRFGTAHLRVGILRLPSFEGKCIRRQASPLYPLPIEFCFPPLLKILQGYSSAKSYNRIPVLFSLTVIDIAVNWLTSSMTKLPLNILLFAYLPAPYVSYN